MEEYSEEYQNLFNKSRNVSALSSISQLLDWDQETYMPSDGANARSEQQKVIAGVIHRERTSPEFKRALEGLIDIESGTILVENLSEPQKAALKMWRRDYINEIVLPSEFVEEFAQVTSQALSVWRKAKKKNAFELFAPFLDKIIQLSQKKADFLGYKDHPYDALLDLYEPEMTTKEVEKIFADLEASITTLLKKISAAPQIDDSFLFGEYDHKTQLEFSLVLLNAMGFNRSRGRLDISTHPFSSSLHPTDNRITTRIHPTGVMSNIASVMHEGGHALYEMGFPVEQFGTPLAQAISYGMHESQSRWWETRIGKSKPFWQYFLPVLKKYFPEILHTIDLDTFYKAINKVQASLIRVEADEVSYPLHIIMRFQMEKDLIGGTLAVRDIPDVWNEKMTKLIGITPQNNSEGCLQDIHWSLGSFGYFPSYSLGNIYASHLFTAFEKAQPDWEAQLASGDLSFVKSWLNENVHQYGRQYTIPELMQKVTNQPLSANAYVEYLTSKFGKIYGLDDNS
ncbi:MAG: carboxypeptidase M32 [Parachlamydiaceae bacterium]|nr:carboxypeptidase M32 [Parachlamydiaceae bacterium]